MASEAAMAYDDLIITLGDEEGVSAGAGEISVNGVPFAWPVGEDLIVRLPLLRAQELVRRGVAELFEDLRVSSAAVRVSDIQLWEELAREAHEFSSEPAVGGES
jgi:hypothetical protein